MNDPDEAGNVLEIMVTSIKPNRAYDATCCMASGEHRFITKPSYIAYAIAEMPRIVHINKMIGLKYYNCHDDFSEELYNRIADGIFDSDETRDSILDYAEAVGL